MLFRELYQTRLLDGTEKAFQDIRIKLDQSLDISVWKCGENLGLVGLLLHFPSAQLVRPNILLFIVREISEQEANLEHIDFRYCYSSARIYLPLSQLWGSPPSPNIGRCLFALYINPWLKKEINVIQRRGLDFQVLVVKGQKQDYECR